MIFSGYLARVIPNTRGRITGRRPARRLPNPVICRESAKFTLGATITVPLDTRKDRVGDADLPCSRCFFLPVPEGGRHPFECEGRSGFSARLNPLTAENVSVGGAAA